MMISRRFGYAFVANQRVGTEAMHLVAGSDADLAYARIGNHKHDTPDQMAAFLAERGLDAGFEDLLVFGVVREPAAWLLSWFNSRSRKALANPAKRNHRNYTGGHAWAEFLELARSDDPPLMTKARPQRAFFTASKGGPDVRPVPFDRVNEVFAKVLPEGSAMHGFRMGDPAHRKNSAKDVRMTMDEMSAEDRRIVNEEILPRDYELYLRARAEADDYPPAVPAAPGELDRRVREEAALDDVAYETAFARAQSLMFHGAAEADIRADVARYVHVDADALLAEVAPRVARMSGR
ncbi:hypothetical protein JQC91_17080 [Jannaschia sp. Os4]|uniref:hypothetical protein n=1 Tax=Jannaschia sp. Os4 TaxID=2807617 RepID=UPI00193A4EEF|nr:hypothetical protein [Jannaschia sp. Os4]MBM2578022.1 hypothetical protein [Jannaschia sp. Os4]